MTQSITLAMQFEFDDFKEKQRKLIRIDNKVHRFFPDSEVLAVVEEGSICDVCYGIATPIIPNKTEQEEFFKNLNLAIDVLAEYNAYFSGFRQTKKQRLGGQR